MAETVDVVVTAQPVALEDALPGVADGARFSVANDSESLVFYRIATTAPAPDAKGHALPPYRAEFFIVASGPEQTWVWCRDPPATLVVTEAA